MQVIVNSDVDDLDKAIQFYTTALDLRLNRRLFDSSVAEMVGPTATIHLLLKPAGTAPFDSSGVTRHYQRHWTPVHLDFAVEDISGTVDRAVAAGAVLHGQIATYIWGHLATLSDPFGHGFCLIQFIDTGYDAVR